MDASYLFETDATLPAQYWYAVARKDILQPEKKLLLAVLEEAIWTYRQNIVTRGPLLDEVEEWLCAKDSEPPFSFQAICEALELNSERLRREIMRPQSEKRRLPPRSRMHRKDPAGVRRRLGLKTAKIRPLSFRRSYHAPNRF
jgi:hypothetical protein